MAGRQDLRDAISEKIEEQHQVTVNANTQITITAGATQAIYTIFSAMLYPDDEVILFDPAYDCYDPSIRLQGAVPIHLELQHPSYTINWKEVKESITPKTKMIVINNPHNPTGSVLSANDILELEKNY